MKKIIFILLASCFGVSNAQVSISNATATGITSGDQIMVYINNANESSETKGFGLPTVATLTDLPYTGSNRPASKVEILRGMLMFVNSTSEAMVFDGQDWSKAFNVVADNISRFRINAATATNGQVELPIDNLIDKANYYADPLRLKTNVPNAGTELNRIYIRQTGVYRLSTDLVFTTNSPSSTSNRLGIKVSVNGTNRFDLLENYVNNNATTYMVSLDTSVYVRQGDYITFQTVPDTAGTSSFTITNASALTVEKIL